jgi:hypothetical protein
MMYDLLLTHHKWPESQIISAALGNLDCLQVVAFKQNRTMKFIWVQFYTKYILGVSIKHAYVHNILNLTSSEVFYHVVMS